MIGIFDSGSGGLTVLKAIREKMPRTDIIYFGDIKNAPYGTKSLDELSVLTVRAIEVLQKKGAHNIVSACNSVSAALALSLGDTLALAPEHLIEMVGPTVSAFKDSTARILLTATPATISSEIYQNAFRMIGKEIATVAIPDLAGAIEFAPTLVVGAPTPEGVGGAEEIEEIIHDAFADIEIRTSDVLILACTHYPLVQDIFAKVLGSIKLFNPAVAVAERVKAQMGASEHGSGNTTFLISKDSKPFRARVQTMVPDSEYSIEVIA